MGCCRRDFRPVIELRCPPVREPAGWEQLPNCGLAPAGRSGVGSWESCLDILDQTGSQKDTWGSWRGEANWPEHLPIGQVCWMTVRVCRGGGGEGGGQKKKDSYEKSPRRRAATALQLKLNHNINDAVILHFKSSIKNTCKFYLSPVVVQRSLFLCRNILIKIFHWGWMLSKLFKLLLSVDQCGRDSQTIWLWTTSII